MNKDNNHAIIIGTIAGEPEYSHTCHGEKFYKIIVSVERSSRNVDMVPVMIPNGLMACELMSGRYIRVEGQVRTYNDKETRKVIMYVYAENIEVLDDKCQDVNDIYIHGFLCKEPVYRITPLGKKIADVIIAANRDYGRSDYIPCIMWGRNSVSVAGNPVGTEVELYGRFQSREYIKDGQTKTAYEVSAMYLFAD